MPFRTLAFVHARIRRPDTHLPEAEPVVTRFPRQEPAERRSWVPPRLRSAARVAVLCLLGCAALAIAAAALSGCSL